MLTWERAKFTVWVLGKWLPPLIARRLKPAPGGPIHVMFCMTDHFEPGTGGVSPDVERARMDQLLTEYPRLAAAHRDSRGVAPQRTWFFPPHYHRRGNLRDLVGLCARGFGEVELHLHHGKTQPDTSEHLSRTIRLCLADYAEFGVFGRQNGHVRYGFIHGDWALSNSRADGHFCGVDDELDVLQDTGCYADFTLPSSTIECNADQVNSIFYATSDPTVRVPYARGVSVERLSPPAPGLMIVQGPLHPFFVNATPLGLRAFHDAIAKGKPATPAKIDAWVATWIHVKGKPDWLIVKTHTHGAVDAESVLGPIMDRTLTHLETRYNDGVRFRLHYVTARELYNIIKAAEAGESGDPGDYRDYLVGRPTNEIQTDRMDAFPELQEAVAQTYRG